VTPQQQIAHYRITGKIGAGGMGEVYRATDTKLGREVALKVLPNAVADDPERLARFEREAKALASLNHPNIAQIYGVENRTLVMELVEGEALRGPLPMALALEYARQIAEGLEAAHEKGIIHRDLKPANVKVTPAGVVKVLDFGLAAVAPSSSAAADPNNSPTLTLAATEAGVIMGTAAYMSPEQAAGKPVDKRSDIWSFGVVLWEMLSGKRLFQGETVTHTLAAVLTQEPDWTRLPASTPAGIRRLLKRCLTRERKNRLPDMGSARLEIQEALVGNVAEPRAAVPKRTGAIAWAAAAICAAAALALAWLHFGRPTPELHVLKVSVSPPEKSRFAADMIPAVSPDGRRIVFAAIVDGKDSLWIRDTDSLLARMLPGTDGAAFPFWSPDSRFVAFFANDKLKKIDAAGGPVLTLCDAAEGEGGSWNQAGVIIFAATTDSILFRVAATGGNPTPITALDGANLENSHRFPWFLPDGRQFLYTVRSNDAERNGVYVASLASQGCRRLFAASSNAVYAPPGYLLFTRSGTLMAQPFDPGKAVSKGEPFPIAEQVDWQGSRTQSQFSVSQNGVLAYISGGNARNVQLTWFDRSGNAIGVLGTPGVLIQPAIAPDGRSVVVDRLDPQTGFYDLWLHDLARGTVSRLTFQSKTNDSPVWSPDGREIVFSSTRDGIRNLYRRAVFAGPDEVLDQEPRRKWADDWSRDGQYLIEDVIAPKTSSDIWVVPLSGNRRPFPFVQTSFDESHGRLSPNGRWLAYSSNETERDEIYVQTFPTHAAKWQVSTKGGVRPVWSRNGAELFFISPDRKLMAVEVKTVGDQFAASVPKPLFPVRLGSDAWFDVNQEGHFLIPSQVDALAEAPMTLVVNWAAGLKK